MKKILFLLIIFLFISNPLSGNASGNAKKKWSRAIDPYPGFFLDISADGKTYATILEDKLLFRSRANDKPLRIITIGKGYVSKMSPDKKLVAKAQESKIDIFDSASGKLISTIKNHSNNETRLAFSPDNKLLATGNYRWSNWTKLILWDVDTGKRVKELGPNANGNSLLFSPDGKYLVDGGMPSVVVWNVKAGKREVDFKPYIAKSNDLNVRTNSVVFTSDSKVMLTGGRDKKIRLWDTSSWKLMAASNELPCEQTSISISPNDKMLAVDSCKELILMDMKKTKVIQKLKVPGVYRTILNFYFSPNGKELLAVTDTSTITLWGL